MVSPFSLRFTLLPFLKPRAQTGVIIQERARDTVPREELDREEDSIDICCEEMIEAMEEKDPKKMAKALRAAFQIFDSEPHEEGPHTNDFHAMNKKAAEEA